MSAGQRVLERRASGAETPPPVTTRSPAIGIWLWSRAAIWAAALFALFTFQPNRNPLAYRWDDPKLTHDLGAFTDVWARWDSVWFLRIAEHGYSSTAHADTAFYPLYPALVGCWARSSSATTSSPGSSSHLLRRWPRSCSCTGWPRSGSGRREPGGRCST